MSRSEKTHEFWGNAITEQQESGLTMMNTANSSRNQRIGFITGSDGLPNNPGFQLIRNP